MKGDGAAILLKEVGVRRGGRWLLRGVNWEVRRGSCAAVVGPNGSGKSTLARVVMGHMWATEGEVRVLGAEFGRADLGELRRSMRLLQAAGPYDVVGDLTAREVVLTGYFGTLGLYEAVTEGMEREAEGMLERVGLVGVADQAYLSLSSGERVRSLIARAMVVKPEVLLLDEPTAGLDILGREQVLATVQSLFENGGEGPAVVLITHHVEELPPATTEVLVLREGRVAGRGSPGEVLRGELLSEAYGCEVEVRRRGGRYYLEVKPEAWGGLMGKGRAGG